MSEKSREKPPFEEEEKSREILEDQKDSEKIEPEEEKEGPDDYEKFSSYMHQLMEEVKDYKEKGEEIPFDLIENLENFVETYIKKFSPDELKSMQEQSGGPLWSLRGYCRTLHMGPYLMSRETLYRLYKIERMAGLSDEEIDRLKGWRSNIFREKE